MNRTQLKRHPERGVTDKAALYAVVDESLYCHLGVETPDGPLVLPMAHARQGDTVYLHGAIANGLLRAGVKAPDRRTDAASAGPGTTDAASAGPGTTDAASAGPWVCATFTIVDGLVFARSHFSHSMNYRCVVAFGELREVTELAEKRAALDALVNHASPERSSAARAPTDGELSGTRVVAMTLSQASMKVRAGAPHDFDWDANQPCWAGVIPIRLTADAPIQDAPEACKAPKGTEPPRLRYVAQAPATSGVRRSTQL